MRRIRVAEVIATLDAAGAERQMAALATRLDRARFDVRVVALTRGGPVEADLRAAGIPVEVIGKSSKLSAKATLALARALREIDPDVIHTHLFTANAYGRAAAMIGHLRAAWVATEHAIDTYKRTHHALIDRALARASAAVVCVSEAVRAANVARGVDPRRIVVIPNGVDVAALERAAAGIAPEPGLVVAAARLSPEKDLPALVRAFAALRARWIFGLDPRLEIAGEGGERARIEAEIERTGSAGAVRLLGHRDDIAAVLARATVVASSSTSEGFGLSIAEAMALGRPVVATCAGGLAELVEDGVTGALVPPCDEATLGKALGWLLSDPTRARAMGEAGRARVRERFSIEAHVAAYERLFERVATGCPLPEGGG